MPYNGVEKNPSGHVFRVDRAAGPVWYAKYRLPDGRQVQKRIGPAWTQRGRPAAGHFTKRGAQASLDEVLNQADAGTLPSMVRTEATVADACREWLRYVNDERAIKHSTSVEYESVVRIHLLPTFGDTPIEDVTVQQIEAWRARMTCSPRTKNKALTVLHGVLRRAQRVWGLPKNPAAEVERVRERPRVDIDVFAGEEVWALVRAASSEQDAAIYLTAAFTGLRRGELIALGRLPGRALIGQPRLEVRALEAAVAPNRDARQRPVLATGVLVDARPRHR